jgi:hypothetical protein
VTVSNSPLAQAVGADYYCKTAQDGVAYAKKVLGVD